MYDGVAAVDPSEVTFANTILPLLEVDQSTQPPVSPVPPPGVRPPRGGGLAPGHLPAVREDVALPGGGGRHGGLLGYGE